MEIVKCALCGSLFQTFNKKICPKCSEKEEEYYKTVKKFIREQPNTKFMDIIKSTGVPERLMRRWLKDGRLEIKTMEGVGLVCERCGKDILQGKLCVDCRQKMQDEIDSEMGKGKKIHKKTDLKKDTKMRFMD